MCDETFFEHENYHKRQHVIEIFNVLKSKKSCWNVRKIRDEQLYRILEIFRAIIFHPFAKKK